MPLFIVCACPPLSGQTSPRSREPRVWPSAWAAVANHRTFISHRPGDRKSAQGASSFRSWRRLSSGFADGHPLLVLTWQGEKSKLSGFCSDKGTSAILTSSNPHLPSGRYRWGAVGASTSEPGGHSSSTAPRPPVFMSTADQAHAGAGRSSWRTVRRRRGGEWTPAARTVLWGWAGHPRGPR